MQDARTGREVILGANVGVNYRRANDPAAMLDNHAIGRIPFKAVAHVSQYRLRKALLNVAPTCVHAEGACCDLLHGLVIVFLRAA